MNALSSALAILLVSSQLLPAQNAGSMLSYHDGKKYQFSFTHAELEQTPPWPSSVESPPLAPRVAIKIAQSYLSQLIPDGAQWRLKEVRLLPIGGGDKWIYVVGFLGPLPAGVADGMVPEIGIVVMMSGVPVKPVISEHPTS